MSDNFQNRQDHPDFQSMFNYLLKTIVEVTTIVFIYLGEGREFYNLNSFYLTLYMYTIYQVVYD